MDADARALRRVALGTALIGAAAFVLIAMNRVPWHPVPGGMPDPVAASSVFSPDQIERAEHFARWGRVWSWSSLALSLAVACWLGFSRRGRAIAERVPGWWWVRVVLVVAGLTVIGRVLTLPFAIALQRLRLDEGLATASWSAWTRDLVNGELITIATTSLALVALLASARAWPRLWPAIAGVGAAGLVVVGSFVYPLVIEPVFNDFTSLPDGQLRSDVLALAKAEGVTVDDVLVADASRRTTTLNAYVSGIGATRRVVLYDNLVNDSPRDQTLSVIAHELGHAKDGDVVTGTALGAAGAMVGVGVLALLLSTTRRRLENDVEDSGEESGGEPQACPGIGAGLVPRILALVAIATLVTAPIQNGISRKLETRADVSALSVTKDAAAFTALQRSLALRSHADPTPPAWSQWWFGSHPTVLERIAVARSSLGRNSLGR